MVGGEERIGGGGGGGGEGCRAGRQASMQAGQHAGRPACRQASMQGDTALVVSEVQSPELPRVQDPSAWAGSRTRVHRQAVSLGDTGTLRNSAVHRRHPGRNPVQKR